MKNQNKNEGKERKNKKGPSAGAKAHKEGHMKEDLYKLIEEMYPEALRLLYVTALELR